MALNIKDSNNSLNMQSKANKKIINCILHFIKNDESYMMNL